MAMSFLLHKRSARPSAVPVRRIVTVDDTLPVDVMYWPLHLGMHLPRGAGVFHFDVRAHIRGIYSNVPSCDFGNLAHSWKLNILGLIGIHI